MSGSEFVEMFVGLGAARVRELFQQAKDKAPALVFLDEVDTICKHRTGAAAGGFGGHDEREQTLNQLLVEMDGFDASKGVIIMAARREKNAVGMAELEEAIDRGVAGLERKSRVINEKERVIVAKHEMGHALVALSVPTADPVHRVSIIPRGVAALGMTMQRPLEDRLAILLGGRTAEEIAFDRISTGAQNDLEKATEIARAMVTEYGMSEKLGPLSFGHDGFRGNDGRALFPSEGPSISDATARLVDEEVARLVESAHARAE